MFREHQVPEVRKVIRDSTALLVTLAQGVPWDRKARGVLWERTVGKALVEQRELLDHL